MPRLFGITEDGVEYDYTVHFAPDPPRLPTMQECHERALVQDLVRAADSAHWARYDGFESVLRALADAVGEGRR